MKWTKRHSQNAVAAKARLRITRSQCLPDALGSLVFAAKVVRPRQAKADFILRIEDRFGERLQISIHRFMGRVHIQGGLSVRQLCRGLEQLLTKSA
jgi:hypothetical protein